MSLLIRSLVARTLGPEALGVLGLSLAWHRVLAQVADLGLHYATVHAGAGSRGHDARTVGIALKLSLGAAASLAGYFASSVVASLVDKPELAAAFGLAALGVAAWSIVDPLQASLRAEGRFATDAVVAIATNTVRLALVGAALGAGSPLLLVLFAYFVAPVSAVALYPFFRPFAIRESALSVARALLATGSLLFLYRLLWLLLLSMDLVVLGRAARLDVVGRYESARTLAYSVFGVTEAIGPVFLRMIGSMGDQRALRRASIILAAGLGGVALLVPIATLLGAAALPTIFGPDFGGSDVSASFGLLLASYLATSAASPFTLALLVGAPRRSQLTVLAVTFAQSIALVVAGGISYPAFGIVGLAAVVLAVHAAGTAVMIALRPRPTTEVLELAAAN